MYKRSFLTILYALSSPPFYSAHVRLPTVNDAVPSEILSNPKFFPFFKDCLGAMDGTHINCCPSAEERHLACDRKGGVTQNTLACCGFDLRFQYMLSGWDGCAQMPACITTPVYLILPSHLVNTIWPMLGLECVTLYWFHTVAFAIILIKKSRYISISPLSLGGHLVNRSYVGGVQGLRSRRYRTTERLEIA